MDDEPGENTSPSSSSPEYIASTTAEEDMVMSEVHLGCPPNFPGPHFSRFTFSLPLPLPLPLPPGAEELKDKTTTSKHQVVSLDEDGDLVVTRRSSKRGGNIVDFYLFKHLNLCAERCEKSYIVTVQHTITSSIPRVGLQVWRAELVLADFVLHKMVTSCDFRGVTAIELGAGTGLVGMLLASDAKTVFLTDHGDEILDNCASNVHLNSKLFNSRASVHVRELNWKDSWPPNFKLKKKYAWDAAELEELQKATLIVAADIIYSDDLTDALFCTLERLVTQGSEKVIYLALEKRYNFALDDLNVVANGYSRFLSYLKVDGDQDDLNCKTWPCFVGKQIDLDQIPQYVREYERGSDVEIWEIKFEKQSDDF